MTGYTEPEIQKSALITIDTQRDTLDGQPFEIAGTSTILPKMKILLAAFRETGLPIVHMVRIYKPDGCNVDLCRRKLVENGAKLVLAGTKGSQLANELLPEPNIRLDDEWLLTGGIQEIGTRESIIYKPRWGGFYDTPLEAHLNKMGVNTLVFCNFPNCPRTSIYEASERDFRLILVKDAVSGIYDQGREEMKNIGVHLKSTHEVVELIVGQAITRQST